MTKITFSFHKSFNVIPLLLKYTMCLVPDPDGIKAFTNQQLSADTWLQC